MDWISTSYFGDKKPATRTKRSAALALFTTEARRVDLEYIENSVLLCVSVVHFLGLLHDLTIDRIGSQHSFFAKAAIAKYPVANGM